jgi:hypothetical protein
MDDQFAKALDEMNEPTPAVEYTPMERAHAQPKEKERPIEADEQSLRKLADDVTESRATEPPPTLREYRDVQSGEKIPQHRTLTPLDAAEDLTIARNAEVAAELAERGFESDRIAAGVDALRAQGKAVGIETEQPRPHIEVGQPQEQQQQPQQPSQDPNRAAVEAATRQAQEILANPVIRQAMEATVAQTEQARQQYATAARNAATVSAASLLSQYPELANVPTNMLETAIASIAQTNPQRAAHIQAHLARTTALYNASEEAKAAQQKIQSQRLEAMLQNEDRRFETEVASKEAPETMRAVKENLVSIAGEYGVSKEELAQLWRTQPIMRTKVMQSVMLDAAKYRLAQRAATEKLQRNIPPVQRPGISQPRSSGDGEAIRTAMARFNADPTPENASKLLIARRNAR